MAAVAAAVVLVAVGVSFLPPAEPSTEWKEYQTSLGEHPVIKLPDGTEVRLNGSVRMSARIVSSGAREVRLDGGEALFKVSHDGSRHFYVSTPEATLEALGTQFNVNVRKGGTVVDVVEGQVGAQANRTLEQLRIKFGMRKAETTVLTRGARAVINDSGDLRTERNPNVDRDGLVGRRELPVHERAAVADRRGVQPVQREADRARRRDGTTGTSLGVLRGRCSRIAGSGGRANEWLGGEDTAERELRDSTGLRARKRLQSGGGTQGLMPPPRLSANTRRNGFSAGERLPAMMVGRTPSRCCYAARFSSRRAPLRSLAVTVSTSLGDGIWGTFVAGALQRDDLHG